MTVNAIVFWLMVNLILSRFHLFETYVVFVIAISAFVVTLLFVFKDNRRDLLRVFSFRIEESERKSAHTHKLLRIALVYLLIFYIIVEGSALFTRGWDRSRHFSIGLLIAYRQEVPKYDIGSIGYIDYPVGYHIVLAGFFMVFSAILSILGIPNPLSNLDESRSFVLLSVAFKVFNGWLLLVAFITVIKLVDTIDKSLTEPHNQSKNPIRGSMLDYAIIIVAFLLMDYATEEPLPYIVCLFVWYYTLYFLIRYISQRRSMVEGGTNGAFLEVLFSIYIGMLMATIILVHVYVVLYVALLICICLIYVLFLRPLGRIGREAKYVVYFAKIFSLGLVVGAILAALSYPYYILGALRRTYYMLSWWLFKKDFYATSWWYLSYPEIINEAAKAVGREGLLSYILYQVMDAPEQIVFVAIGVLGLSYMIRWDLKADRDNTITKAMLSIMIVLSITSLLYAYLPVFSKKGMIALRITIFDAIAPAWYFYKSSSTKSWGNRKGKSKEVETKRKNRSISFRYRKCRLGLVGAFLLILVIFSPLRLLYTSYVVKRGIHGVYIDIDTVYSLGDIISKKMKNQSLTVVFPRQEANGILLMTLIKNPVMFAEVAMDKPVWTELSILYEEFRVYRAGWITYNFSEAPISLKLNIIHKYNVGALVEIADIARVDLSKYKEVFPNCERFMINEYYSIVILEPADS